MQKLVYSIREELRSVFASTTGRPFRTALYGMFTVVLSIGFFIVVISLVMFIVRLLYSLIGS